MAENDSGKSMDDVLASIRRIVRAERDADGPGSEEAQVVAGGQDGDEGDAPLALTPDMMSDAESPGGPAPVPAPPPHDPGPSAADAPPPVDVFGDPVGEAADLRPRAAELAPFVNAPDPIDAEPEAPAPAAPAIDEDTLREMVREVIREELAAGQAEGMVREIIRSELTTGEIGANISRNVLRLVRSEVAKARG